jgi:hypothetical protein
MAVHSPGPRTIFGLTTADLGALLTGVGALLLLGDALTGTSIFSGTTLAGTLPTPERRAADAAAVAGSGLVAAGAVLLLLGSRSLGAVAVVVVIAIAGVLVYVVMTLRLHAHLVLAKENDPAIDHSWRWCFTHPLWRP